MNASRKKFSTRITMLLCLAMFGAQVALAQHPDLTIELVRNDTSERATKDQLIRLTKSYQLDKWLFTKRVVIESGRQVIPHSHPVLTLSTRHLKDDELLLSTFIHEQLHWYISDHPQKDEILAALKQRHPSPMTDFPYGSGGETDTYFHLIICYLEYSALIQLIGEFRAYQVMLFWQQDHYTWVYKTVLEDRRSLHAIATQFKLLQKPASASSR
jgi:hypothetical protein